MEDSVIQVTGFRKSYGGATAVDGISFEVHRGEIFGLLGPNGAGKTTTLESLEGLRVPDAGTLRVMGVDPTREPRRLSQVIGVQLQASGLPDSIRVEEAMRFFSAYHGVPSRTDLLERLGLGEKLGAQYNSLSTGQQRRLALALAVAHNPPIVLLDEPTAGLDVPARVELHALIRDLQTTGTTFVLATHDMAEAEKLADRVAILLRGRIAATGTPRELTAAGAGLTKVSVKTDGGCLIGGDGSFDGVTQRVSREDYAVFYTSDPGPTVTAIIAHVGALGDSLVDLRVERPSLEERFLEIARGPESAQPVNGGVER